jgi:hypothetical protein
MKNRIENPCVYHYLFSRLPVYRIDQEVASLANRLSAPIIESFRLDTDEIFAPPYPDVMPLLYKGNDKSQTYLLQFWFNDILTTVLSLNQRNQSQDPLLYFQNVLNPSFPNPEKHVRFGEMTVLFSQAKEDIAVVEQIAAACFKTGFDEKLPCCQFEWGTMYWLPNANRYILLISDATNLPQGDTFLAFDFPMLEAIKQKLIYEEAESSKLKAQNIKIESALRDHLKLIAKKLDGKEDNSAKVEEVLDMMDGAQAELYDNVSKIDAVLHTLAINIGNFKTYLELIPVKQDSLFKSMPKKFHLIYENIETSLKYTKLLLPGILKRQETIQLKIDFLRQRAQERSNKIEKRQNTLIAVLGVAIGVLQVLPEMDWKFRLLWMGLSGTATYVLVHLFDLKILKKKEKELLNVK